MNAERFRGPLIKRCTIETYFSARWMPYADEHACDRRFSGSTGPDDTEPISALELQIYLLRDDLLGARRHDGRILDRQALGRRLQGHGLRLFGHQLENLSETVPALPGGNEALPVGDREVDGRERARGQDST